MAKQAQKTTKVNFMYSSYQFRQDEQDPIIDRVRTLLDDLGVKHSKVSASSGISQQTLSNWFNGHTRRPQFATIAAVVRSQGYDVVLAPRQNVSRTAPSSIGQIMKRFPTKAELTRHAEPALIAAE